MSIFSALRSAYSYEDAFGAKSCTSQAMREAVKEWFRLYYQREADLAAVRARYMPAADQLAEGD